VYTWTWCLLSVGKEAASENGAKRGFCFPFFFPSLFHPCHPGVYTNLVFTRVRSWLVIRAYDTDLILYDGVVSCPCDIDLMLVWSNPARGAGARKGAISRRARAGVTGKSQNFSNFISIASAYSNTVVSWPLRKFEKVNGCLLEQEPVSQVNFPKTKPALQSIDFTLYTIAMELTFQNFCHKFYEILKSQIHSHRI